MTAPTLELVTAPVDGDFDDDLIHAFCEECNLAFCDGGECIEDAPVSPDDLVCVVCDDLDAELDDCPHCGAPLADTG